MHESLNVEFINTLLKEFLGRLARVWQQYLGNKKKRKNKLTISSLNLINIIFILRRKSRKKFFSFIKKMAYNIMF